MIAHLVGMVADISEEHAIIDVSGVGYLVNMPQPDLAGLQMEVETRVHVHTYVREDQLTLYGFLSPGGRKVFAKLITISGVGPKLALSILSTYALPQLKDIAAVGNVNALKKIKGVGKKTAERLALELTDLLADLVVAQGSSGASRTHVPAPSRGKPNVWDDAHSALGHLGFSASQADEALSQARQEGLDESDLDAIIKFALSVLRKR